MASRPGARSPPPFRKPGPGYYARRTTHANWRYLIDSFPGRLPELNKHSGRVLNMRGNQGWELIHFGRLNKTDVELIFKQPA